MVLSRREIKVAAYKASLSDEGRRKPKLRVEKEAKEEMTEDTGHNPKEER